MEPLEIKSLRIHEAWAVLAEELIKWGEFQRAKDLATESSLHARILKDPDCYAKTLISLSQIAFTEGSSAQSLKIAMMSHACVRDMQLLEKCVVHTFDLLAGFGKWEDVQNLLNPLTNMLTSFRRNNNDSKVNTQSEVKAKTMPTKSTGQQAANIPLEYTIASAKICQAISHLNQALSGKMLTLDEQNGLLDASYKWCSQFMSQISTYGYR
jgi:hypothetical protein